MISFKSWRHRAITTRCCSNPLLLINHVDAIRCEGIPVLRWSLSILIVLVPIRIHIKDSTSLNLTPIHHLILLLLSQMRVKGYRLGRNEILLWRHTLPILELWIYHLGHHDCGMRRCSSWIVLVLLLLNMRWRYHSSTRCCIDSILVPWRLRLVLGLMMILLLMHHMVLKHYRSWRKIGVAIVVWSPSTIRFW